MSDTERKNEPSLVSFPENPNFGHGMFRRRIRLSGNNLITARTDGATMKVFGELEDCNHGFRVSVYHDGKQVIAIDADFMRIPYNTCSSADQPLKRLIGTAVNTPCRNLTMLADPVSNCTHLLDLTVLAIAHAHRGAVTTTWDVTVSDETDAPADIQVLRDEQLIHHWQARDFTLTAPVELAGKTLYRGFAAWANGYFSGLENEAAFILQKGFFVSHARRYDVDAMANQPASKHAAMQGNCHTYGPANINQAIRMPDTVRDFTDTPEQLLKFL